MKGGRDGHRPPVIGFWEPGRFDEAIVGLAVSLQQIDESSGYLAELLFDAWLAAKPGPHDTEGRSQSAG